MFEQGLQLARWVTSTSIAQASVKQNKALAMCCGLALSSEHANLLGSTYDFAQVCRPSEAGNQTAAGPFLDLVHTNGGGRWCEH